MLLLTCVIHGVPHLKATDGAQLAFGVASEDQLRAQHERQVGQIKSPKPCKT